MSNATGAQHTSFAGQTVLILGASSGIGLSVAQQARAAGANVIMTARDPDRLSAAASSIGAAATAAFDITDHEALSGFFEDLTDPIDHVFVSGSGPYYAPLGEIDLASARDGLATPIVLMIDLAQLAPPHMRPGGSLIFMGGTGARRPAPGLSVIGPLVAAASAAVANLALEIAPARINLVAAGFVDSPLSARILGPDLDARREDLAARLPIHRVVQPDDVASLVLYVMSNTALTGSVYDIDGGQQLLG